MYCQSKKWLEEGDISKTDFDKFLNANLQLHKASFLYAANIVLLENNVLKHFHVWNILQQQCVFESVLFLAERFKHYILFTKNKMIEMEQELLCLQSLTLDDFSLEAKEEATINVDENGDSATFRIDILWYCFS